jgi:hypothetical protein
MSVSRPSVVNSAQEFFGQRHALSPAVGYRTVSRLPSREIKRARMLRAFKEFVAGDAGRALRAEKTLLDRFYHRCMKLAANQPPCVVIEKVVAASSVWRVRTIIRDRRIYYWVMNDLSSYYLYQWHGPYNTVYAARQKRDELNRRAGIYYEMTDRQKRNLKAWHAFNNGGSFEELKEFQKKDKERLRSARLAKVIIGPLTSKQFLWAAWHAFNSGGSYEDWQAARALC